MTPPKGPAERAEEIATKWAQGRQPNPDFVADIVNAITAEYASIEQERNQKQQLLTEAEIALIDLRKDRERIEQENEVFKNQIRAMIEGETEVQQENSRR